MSYSCTDFYDDVANALVAQGLIDEQELASKDGEPEAPGIAMVNAINRFADARITTRELGTILAALRVWQVRPYHPDDQFADIATSGGELVPLLDDEIDDLCMRINGSALVKAGEQT